MAIDACFLPFRQRRWRERGKGSRNIGITRRLVVAWLSTGLDQVPERDCCDDKAECAQRRQDNGALLGIDR